MSTFHCPAGHGIDPWAAQLSPSTTWPVVESAASASVEYVSPVGAVKTAETFSVRLWAFNMITTLRSSLAMKVAVRLRSAGRVPAPDAVYTLLTGTELHALSITASTTAISTSIREGKIRFIRKKLLEWRTEPLPFPAETTTSETIRYPHPWPFPPQGEGKTRVSGPLFT